MHCGQRHCRIDGCCDETFSIVDVLENRDGPLGAFERLSRLAQTMVCMSKIHIQTCQSFVIGCLFEKATGLLGAAEQLVKTAQTEEHAYFCVKRPPQFDPFMEAVEHD